MLEAESNLGVGVCYNEEDGFKSLGSIIATGENSFTYLTTFDEEQENSWEEEFEAIKDANGDYIWKNYHENNGGSSSGMIVTKDLKTKGKPGKKIRKNIGLS